MLEVRRSVAKWGAWPKSTRGPGDTAQYPIAHPAAGMTAPPQLGAQQASAQTSHANTIPKFDLGELAAHLPEVATRTWGSHPDSNHHQSAGHPFCQQATPANLARGHIHKDTHTHTGVPVLCTAGPKGGHASTELEPSMFQPFTANFDWEARENMFPSWGSASLMACILHLSVHLRACGAMGMEGCSNTSNWVQANNKVPQLMSWW